MSAEEPFNLLGIGESIVPFQKAAAALNRFLPSIKKLKVVSIIVIKILLRFINII